jgi:hypothetical protein
MAFEAVPAAASTAPELPELSSDHKLHPGFSELDMGFMPPGEMKETVPGVKWHSVGPTRSDITTRPHRALASKVVQI